MSLSTCQQQQVLAEISALKRIQAAAELLQFHPTSRQSRERLRTAICEWEQTVGPLRDCPESRTYGAQVLATYAQRVSRGLIERLQIKPQIELPHRRIGRLVAAIAAIATFGRFSG